MKLPNQLEPAGGLRQNLFRALIGDLRHVQMEQGGHDLQIVRDSMLQLGEQRFALLRQGSRLLSLAPQALDGDVQRMTEDNNETVDEDKKEERDGAIVFEVEGMGGAAERNTRPQIRIERRPERRARPRQKKLVRMTAGKNVRNGNPAGSQSSRP